jgi:transcriptional regulator with XRE-family HTH domain
MKKGMEAAKWLKTKREAEGLSYRELGLKVDINHTTLSKAENEGVGTTETWTRLAEHYGESVLRVLYWAGVMKYPPPDSDVATELLNKITHKILKGFPESEWENVLKHAINDVEWLQGTKKQNGTPSKRTP